MTITLYKENHLKTSKTFCILPWVHLHATPTGTAAPCCIAKSCTSLEGMGDTKRQSIIEIINSPKMKELRLDMLEGRFNNECKKCHEHEEKNVGSARQMFNNQFKDLYDECLENTNEDGSLKKFKMRYFDIRFNNICNFKCRTCNAGCSSQWEQENLKYMPMFQPLPKNNDPNFLQEIIDQVPNIKMAYFAGGEPLITEQHYILLEEMIRSGKSDEIVLRYNTNLSNLNFKNKDLISLWGKFKNKIDLHASIDHYGERAEYIRHGTSWGQIEENILKIKQMPNVIYQINTVLSVFNLLTIDKFYEYMYEKQLYTNLDRSCSLYSMSSPEMFTCHILPISFKEAGVQVLKNATNFMYEKKYNKNTIFGIENSIEWIRGKNLWEELKVEFKKEIERVDNIRGENFRETFPELSPLLDLE